MKTTFFILMFLFCLRSYSMQMNHYIVKEGSRYDVVIANRVTGDWGNKVVGILPKDLENKAFKMVDGTPVLDEENQAKMEKDKENNRKFQEKVLENKRIVRSKISLMKNSIDSMTLSELKDLLKLMLEYNGF